MKTNPYVKTKRIATTVFLALLVATLLFFTVGLSIIFVIQGFVDGSPWYVTFGFPLTLLGTILLTVGVIYLVTHIEIWWEKLEDSWYERYRD